MNSAADQFWPLGAARVLHTLAADAERLVPRERRELLREHADLLAHAGLAAAAGEPGALDDVEHRCRILADLLDTQLPEGTLTAYLRVWSVLSHRAREPVPFSALVAEVVDDEAIRRDASSVDFDAGLLAQELLAVRDRILGQARAEIDELESLLASISFLVLAATPRLRERPWWRRGVAGRIEQAVLLAPQPLVFAAAFARAAVEGGLARLEPAVLALDTLVRTAIEQEARQLLNTRAQDLLGTRLRLASTEGLAQVIDPRLEIGTKASARLAELLRRMKGGSVGLAGPRGAGKSTLIRRFVDGREALGERPLLAVQVPAPVVYDSRDFLLHLYAALCRAAGADRSSEGRVPLGSEPGPLPARALRVAGVALPILALWLVIGGVAGVVAALLPGDHDLVVWGQAVGVAAIAATGVSAVRPTDGGGFLLGMGAAGMALIAAGAWTVDVPAAAFEAAGVVAVGWLLAPFARLVEDAAASEDGLVTDTRRLHASHLLPLTAAAKLAELRYQQSSKTAVSAKLGVTAGLELGASTERGMARYPMSFPELVDDFARFLAVAAESYDVLIAIDELDKLRADDDMADRFLNDLKAAFGVPNTYFLVSVSEDAMSRFERRGLPFRDVFDSTFDEIVRVEPLDLGEAQALLARRVVGLPYIYSGLCHVLSAGVPRDLIRMARRMVQVSQVAAPAGELAPIARMLVGGELAAKIAAVEVAAGMLEPESRLLDPFLAWLRAFAATQDDDAQLLAAATGDERLPHWPPVPADEGHHDAEHRRALARPAGELSAYGYFIATACAFFQRPFSEADVTVAAHCAAPALDRLARARMAFGVSAQTARFGVAEFRALVELDAQPPRDLKARGIAANRL